MSRSTELAPRPGEQSGQEFRVTGRGTVSKAAQVVMAKAKGELDLVDHKTFNYLLSRVYAELRVDEASVHRVPVADVLAYLGHSSTDRLHESLSRLGSVEIEIDWVDQNGVPNSAKVHYLSYNIARARDGWVHFAFDPLLVGFLHNPKIFANLSLAHIRRFRSVYAAKLYEIMAMYVNRHHPVWSPSVDQFREQMAVGGGYDRFDNLKKRVIEAAVEEVSEIAPFSVTVEYLRTGRGGKVTDLRFTATAKGPATLLDMRTVNDPIGRSRSSPRDQHTVDLLDGRIDAERADDEVSRAAIERALTMIGADATVEPYLERWRESMRGRRIRDADRSFLNWLDLTLAKEREAALDVLEEDTFSSLLEQWEGAR